MILESLGSNPHTMTAGVGTSCWVAPEVLLGSSTYNESCDIYSLSVVLSELDSQVLPYNWVKGTDGEPLSEWGIITKVANGELQPKFSPFTLPTLVEIGVECVAFDPSKRPTAVEIGVRLRALEESIQ